MRRLSALAVAGVVVVSGLIGVSTARSANVSGSYGLVDPSTGIWHLYAKGIEVDAFFFGDPGDYPFIGDWDCDGVDTPGLYRQSDGYVYLRNTNSQGVADVSFFFGDPGDVPIAGDFDGDGCDTLSIYRPSEARFYIINRLGTSDGGLGAADYSFLFGDGGDKPFVGDFDGDGVDTVGLHRESTGLVYFRNTNTAGNADIQFVFGDPDDLFIAGDWNGDGIDSPGVFRPLPTPTVFLKYTNEQGNADLAIPVGQPNWVPIAGLFVGSPPDSTTTTTTSTTSTTTTTTLPNPRWGVEERLSVSSTETQGDGHSGGSVAWGLGVSGDGNLVAFLSNSTNLVDGQSNSGTALYIRNRAQGTTQRVGPAECCGISMTHDGRYVAYANSTDVVVFDLQSGSIARQWNGTRPSISSNGQYVASELNGVALLTEVSTGSTTTISVDIDGQAVNGDFVNTNEDGSISAFYTGATGVVNGDTNAADDVFVFNRNTGDVELISQSTSGVIGNGPSVNGLVSPDGRYVVFHSSASNLDPADGDTSGDVFIRDRVLGTTSILVDRDFHPVAMSADNRYVTFSEWPGTSWILDRTTADLSRLDVSVGGEPGNRPLGLVIYAHPVVSADGSVAVFASEASNLVPSDTNDRVDVFLSRLQ